VAPGVAVREAAQDGPLPAAVAALASVPGAWPQAEWVSQQPALSLRAVPAPRPAAEHRASVPAAERPDWPKVRLSVSSVPVAAAAAAMLEWAVLERPVSERAVARRAVRSASPAAEHLASRQAAGSASTQASARVAPGEPPAGRTSREARSLLPPALRGSPSARLPMHEARKEVRVRALRSQPAALRVRVEAEKVARAEAARASVPFDPLPAPAPADRLPAR
jgi:hypothetical protein